MKRHNLLIVDDEKEILRSLKLTFSEDHEVFTASSGTEALEILQQQDIALIITDQRMPQMTGVELLKQVIQINPQIIRIILTGYTDTAALIEAINQGHIYQYITKPWERQDFRLVIRRALETYELEIENRRLLKELQAVNERLKIENTFLRTEINKDLQCAEIVGRSPAMQQVFQLVNRVIGNSATVLLAGETGTGKTLLACHIHSQGPRKDRLFIEQNCGTLPETLLESELFGYKRGAFTGAVQDRKGLFEVADGGTLFLDEISEMSPMLQVKLLQILQDGRFRRVGDNEYRQVDVRIIAATNKNLPVEIQQGRFRQDLYYRINVFPIYLPPLRERTEDIPLLADYCLKKKQHKLRISVHGFSEKSLQALCDYDYPGNVRELENLVERALILSTGDQIEPGEWLPVSMIDTGHRSRLEKMEQAEIRRLLELHQGNLSLVAKDLGISRTTLWRRMKDYRSLD
ncbi:MAG TPA: sigma-54 dependent transcriptional regulator [Candidatus Competibacteraceae bacterium]|nr:sigma-54 dependent transcriptional regulator [Candidatus Competibacteraceae bacterium]HRZ05507.1 sigma-54 dependent transcriptional regulator [Candidatus Competibacteraceae bacterium]HSA45987.1 sigma-54 dependent transcriptional regulator [Candidatus Competibacteraceae bacterium]